MLTTEKNPFIFYWKTERYLFTQRRNSQWKWKRSCPHKFWNRSLQKRDVKREKLNYRAKRAIWLSYGNKNE